MIAIMQSKPEAKPTSPPIPMYCRAVDECDLAVFVVQEREVNELRLMQALRDGLLYDPILRKTLVF